MRFVRKRIQETADEHPTVRRVEALLQRALEGGASDLHVGPDEGGGFARARVDGFFRELERLEKDDVPRVIARLKVLAGLPAFRTMEPQDGALRIATAGGFVDARIATVPVVGGEKVAVRFLDVGGPRELDELGLPAPALARAMELLALPGGAVVVVGPCSSGKSTTLRAMARRIAATRGAFTHVAAVEDPVEQRMTGVTQVEIDPARGLDFPRALAALLRQDPQVLLIGEMRDAETARIGIEAALTGHLVLTSLHVGSVDDVPRRLEILGVSPRLVAAALRGVINQRLVRRACAACTGSGSDCAACAGSGHRGRFALAEIAVARDGTLELSTPSLARAAEDALELGWTSRVEIDRVLANGDPR
jgi:type II secretory ATPase GspE/PulE/Tfp pilus assembly ATPase PilB-like protein